MNYSIFLPIATHSVPDSVPVKFADAYRSRRERAL